MPEKFSVQAVFTAVDHFSGPVGRMSDTLNKFNGKGLNGGRGPKMAAVYNEAGAAMGRMGERAASVRNKLAMVGVAGAFAARKMFMAGADLEDALLQGSSKFGDGIRRNTPQFEELKKAALDLGRTTKFGAVEAAGALNELAASGFEPQSAIKNLPILGKMAIAGGEELQTASMIAVDSMGAFGMISDKLGRLRGPDEIATNLTRVADVMAYTANQTTASMGSIYETLSEAGSIGDVAEMTFEKFAAITGTLAQIGIKGSQAGTAIKNISVRLLSPNPEGDKELRRLGIDSKAFRKMADPLDQLEVFSHALEKLPKEDKIKALDEYFGKISLAAAASLTNGGFRNARILEHKIQQNAAGSNDRQAGIIGEGAGAKIGMLENAFQRINTAIFDKIKGPFEEATESVIKFIDANEGAISDSFKNGVGWLKTNMPQIVQWLKWGGYAILGMQAAGALHSMVTLGQDLFLIGRGLITVVPKLWGATTALTTFIGVAQTGSGMGLLTTMAGGFTAVAIAAGAAAAAIGSVMLAYNANEELKTTTEGLGFLDLLDRMSYNAYHGGSIDPAKIVDDHQNELARKRAHTRAMLEASSPAGALTGFDAALSSSQYGPAAVMQMMSKLEQGMNVAPLNVPPEAITVQPVDMQPLFNAIAAQIASSGTGVVSTTDARLEQMSASLETKSSMNVKVEAEHGTKATVGPQRNHTKVNNHRNGMN